MASTKHLRIKPHYSLVAHDENTVELRAGVWNPYSHTLVDEDKTGSLLKILQCLNGSLSVSDIANNLNISRTQIESLLDHLQRLGVLTSTATSAFQHYVDTLNPVLCHQGTLSSLQQNLPILLIGPTQLTQQVQAFLSQYATEQSITLVANGDALVMQLESNNDEWMHDDLLFADKLQQYHEWRHHFVIFVQYPPQPLSAFRFNRIAQHLEIPWLYATIDGPYIFIGPQFVPPAGPCFECFETRLMMNLRESANYQQYKNALSLGRVHHPSSLIEPALVGLVAAHVALEALNFILTSAAFTRNKVLAIYLPTMEIIYHEVFRVANCTSCGATMHRDEQQLYFTL